MPTEVLDVAAEELTAQVGGMSVYPASIVNAGGNSFFLGRRGTDDLLGVATRAEVGALGAFAGTDTSVELGGQPTRVRLCSLTPANAQALRDRFPWLRPVPLGLRTSAGLGDRLGLATPGHVQAAREFGSIAPIFAQQSVRENARTGRTPQQVMDDAMWGVFQMGWQGPWGSDADHLKTPEAMDPAIAAGYTQYTIDPGDHVDNAAHTAPPADVAAKVQALPWDALEDTAQDMERRYLGRSIELEGAALAFDRETLARAAAKYGRALAHTVQMYRCLVERIGETPFDLEVSVDETETPTSAEEHYFIANELRRLGVKWVSLAPRYIGRFEKGVDYIGDLRVFEVELAKHAAIARALGPYKLSIHSGSDKFSIYPIIARLSQGLVHVKTAGTSYLEALRAVAQMEPALFRDILVFARDHYDVDQATYYVSAQLTKVPAPDVLSDADLPDLLDQFDARQVLHVTYGSVLDRFGGRLMATLHTHAEVYGALLRVHFERHLAPFAHAA